MLNENEIRTLRYNLHNTDLHFTVLYETIVDNDDMYSDDYDYMFMIKYRNSVYKLYINNNYDYNIVFIDDYGDFSIFEYHDTNIDNIIETVHNIILIDYNGMVIKQFINNNNIVIDNKLVYDFNIRTVYKTNVNEKVKYHFESDGKLFSVINNYNDEIVDFHDLNSALEYLIKKCNFEF